MNERERKTIRFISIEQSGGTAGGAPCSDWWVCSIGTWPKSSVLAGQTKFARHRCFDNLKDAEAWCIKHGFISAVNGTDKPETPEDIQYHIQENGFSAKPSVPASIGPCPAGYYDPGGGFYDAGEYWDEDDV